MSNGNQQLLQQVGRILKSNECLAIRFKLENISIHTFTYMYIAQVMLEGRLIRVVVGSGNGYDNTTTPRTLTFASADPQPGTIVHEATHAVIDATHKGQTIQKGANEAAAFLAEAVYELLADESWLGTSTPHYFARAFYKLAKNAINHNSNDSLPRFVCPPGDVMNLKALIGTLPDYSNTNLNQNDTMQGIGDGA